MLRPSGSPGTLLSQAFHLRVWNAAISLPTSGVQHCSLLSPHPLLHSEPRGALVLDSK